MEKLQNALKKAQADRSRTNADRPSPIAHAHPQRSRASGSGNVPWADIALVELNPEIMKKNLIFTMSANSSAVPFDILRTKILSNMKKNGWTRLAITSPDGACGKTTIFCNLAASLTRQRDVRAIMLEMDLRRPSVSAKLGLSPDVELTDALRKERPLSDCLKRISDNVALATVETAVADSSQVLLSEVTTRALDEAESAYSPNLMIFDVPPMLVSDDARAVLRHADCALIVARAEQTAANRLDICEHEVAQLTNVLGVVLNDCRHISASDAEFESYY